jgi:cytoskeleton protein RodZ
VDREYRSTSFIGEKLRQERIRKGIHIRQVSEATRISERFLHAIESGDTGSIPGGFFAKSFIRQYAKYLGVYDESLEDQVSESFPTQRSLPNPPEHLSPSETGAPLLPFGSSAPERNRTSPPMSVALLLLTIVGCSALFMLWQRGREEPTAAQGPAARIGAAAKPDGPAVERSTQAEESPAAGQPTQGATAPATPPVAAGPPPSSPVYLTLSATEAVWVRASSDGRTVFAATLQPGESRTVEAQQQMRLLIGNAGGLHVTWNGKALGAAGPRGQIRVMEFTPERYGFVTRTSPES